MNKSRPVPVVGIGITVGLALLLTGCGTTEPAADAGTATSTAVIDPAPSSDPAAAGETVDGGTGSAAAAEPITVTDARGKEITLAGPAVRIAAAEWNSAEYLVSLGVQPVAVADIAGYRTWSSAEPLDGTQTDIGTRGEPSLDTLAGLDLDLVLVTDSLVEGAIEQIEAEIPVIVMPGGDAADPIGAMWDNIDLVATVTGTEDTAAALKTEFEDVLAKGAAAVDAAGAAGQPVAFSDAYDLGSSVFIRPYGEGSLVGAVLAEIGLPSGWDGIEFDAVYGLGQTDIEGLTNLGDVAFWYIANDESPDPYMDVLGTNAVWTSLPFVAAGNVTRLPDSMWMFGGPTSMAQFVEAAVAALG